jgi:uncharacterized membrane protein YeaQ/YmgE (transglycosylase-associated protein family)
MSAAGGSDVFLVLAALVGAIIGAVACLPRPHAGLRHVLVSIALGLFGSLLGWQASIPIGEDQVGPLAQLFVSVVAAGAIVFVYHAATSERSKLR